jgi:hypothetical protein
VGLFTAALTGFVVYLGLVRTLTSQEIFFFDVWMAFNIGCSAAIVCGVAVADGKVALLKDSPPEISVAVGMAAFVIVLLSMHSEHGLEWAHAFDNQSEHIDEIIV